DLRKSKALPKIDTLLVAPALHCRQTAGILFPGLEYSICQLEEIDFGIFGGKNAGGLIGCKEYGAWLDTGCMGDIPGGGSVKQFKDNSCGVFKQILETSSPGVTAIVAHGGNIMAILEKFVLPQKGFFDYRLPNAGFILCRLEEGALYIESMANPG
ncbi:MAG: histidine phosphatase family protein, partial [Clostridiales bacterium]|nr:histidine phosphatase family protein [Clostridiales bacterium]